MCRTVLATRDAVIPALGHSWGAWRVTKAATETAEGTESRTCAHDPRHTETRAVPKLAHTHSLRAEPAVEPGCTEEGRRAYWICKGCGKLFADARGTAQTTWEELYLSPLGHSAESQWERESASEPGCTVPGYDRLALCCSRCGEILSTRGEKTPALGHEWGEWTSTREATETQDGAEMRVCLHDVRHTETRTVPRLAHRHSLTAIAAVKPGCTEAGNSAYWKCSGCGLCFADAAGARQIEQESVILLPLGHSADNTWDTAGITEPDCETPGERELELHCARCRELLAVRTELIPAAGHDWKEPEYIWSDDLSVVIAERVCRNNEYHIEQEISDDIEISILIPASCEEAGEDLYTAYFENEAFEAWKSEETEALGHNWGEWVTTKEPTETTAGEQVRNCLNDPSHTQTATIPKTGHVHSLTKTEAKVPSCTGEGNKAYWVCEGGEEPCGRLFTDASGKNEVKPEDYGTLILPALSHQWKESGVGWTDDFYSAVFHFTCAHDAAHTCEVLGEALTEPEITACPTPEKDGELSFTVTAFLDGEAYQADRVELIAPEEYSYIQAQRSWLKGSEQPAEFRVRRGDGGPGLYEGLSYRFFTGVEIDGMTVPADRYIAEDGSLILSLSPACLEALPVGEHVLRTCFTDGSVSTDFRITDGPAFRTHALVLSGEIGIRFYMELPEIEGVDYSDSYMSFRVKDLEKRADFDSGKKNRDGKYYEFSCYVPSIMMAQPITATFHYGDGLSVEQTYTIEQYIRAFEEKREQFSPAAQKVVEALADYGHYIQPFLSEARGWQIGTDYAEMTTCYKQGYSEAELAAVEQAVADCAIVRDTGDSRIEKLSFTLVLDSATSIHVFLKPKSGYTGEVTAVLDGGTQNAAVRQRDGRYLVTIPNISAHELGDTHTIRVSAGSSFTVELSALSYIQGVLSSKTYGTDPQARNAMAALYEYYRAVVSAGA